MYQLEEVCTLIADFIFNWYRVLSQGDFGKINSAYLSRLYRYGEWSDFRKGDERFKARITGIGEFGQLITEGRTGNVSEFMFKEVEMIL